MTIKIGDTLPAISLKRLGENGMEAFDTLAEVKGKTVVLFGVPGAFTPTCAQKHLPGYIAAFPELKAKGVDDVICMAVNDPFVMQHWGSVSGADGKIHMWPDGNAALSDAMGLTFDGSGAGLGKRAVRFSMLLKDGIVQDLQIEEKPSDHELSSASACMARLK